MRREHDAYMTPAPLARAIVEAVANVIEPPQRILEPTAGEGAFVTAAADRWPDAKILAVDVREECRAFCTRATKFVCADVMSMTSVVDFDLIIGNPPFQLAERILQRFQLLGAGRIAMLLPMSFFSGPRAGDGRLLAAEIDLRILPVYPRPSFIENGKTDRFDFGVGLFGFDAPGYGPPIRWKKRSTT